MRSWLEEDLAPFAALNADPMVMEHFPSTLTRQESDALVVRITAQLDTLGFGLWALEVEKTGEFIGFTGLAVQTFPGAVQSVDRGRMAAAAVRRGVMGTRRKRPSPRSTTASRLQSSTRSCR